MSYDISLHDPTTDQVLPTEHFIGGGTHNIYGSNECDFNVTYNYSQVYSLVDFSMWDLNGKTAEESLPKLREVAEKLIGGRQFPPQPHKDYWAPTPGNALLAIQRLIVFAEAHPTGVWQVT